jgi:hypothetical protein
MHMVLCELLLCFGLEFLIVYKWTTFWNVWMQCTIQNDFMSFDLCLWTMIIVDTNMVVHDKGDWTLAIY